MFGNKEEMSSDEDGSEGDKREGFCLINLFEAGLGSIASNDGFISILSLIFKFSDYCPDWAKA